MLLKEPSREKDPHILHFMTGMHFLLRKKIKISCMVMSKCMCCADRFVGQRFIRFCTKLYRQVVGIPKGTTCNCALLVADLFLFCYERDFIIKVSKVAKIRNRYNQVPHLTQDTNGKVTNSQKTPQTRAKRSALSQQVTTKHI